MRTNLLTAMGAAATMVFALSGSASAADYVRKTTGPLGILDYTRVKHTEIGIVGYQTQKSHIRDQCGGCTTIIQRTPVYGEVVTGRSLTINLHPKERRCLTSISCGPCTTYTPKKCNPCDSGYRAQPIAPVMTEQPYQFQPRTESILTPVPDRRQEPTLAPVPQARPSMVPPPLPEPPKTDGPELNVPQEPATKSF